MRFALCPTLASSMLAILLTGCGGSGKNDAGWNTSDGSSLGGGGSSSAPAPAPAPAPEILINNQFANALANWNYNYVTLVPSELRLGGQAVNTSWQVSQTLSAGALQPGQAYTLVVKARKDSADATATVAMRFRKPRYSESFRTYTANVAEPGWQDIRIDFTAPAYTGMADVILTAKSGHLVIDSASLKARDAIAQTEPIESTAGSFVPPGYTLAFNDEFNGTTLNRSKWFTRYIYGAETSDHLNDEKQHYRDNDNHRVADGVLSLVARKVSSTAAWGMNYESGMIRSDWTTRYGYFEARVKMPGGVGLWPAFWLNSDVDEAGRLGWPPEIDIFEFVNNDVEDRTNMIHQSVVRQTSTTDVALTFNDTSFSTSNNDYYAPFNFNEGWHTVGCEWTPDQVTFYVDGVKTATRHYTWTYNDGSLAGPAHILLNLAVGGSWAGRHGIDDTAFPQAMQVDWVRAYKKG